MSHMRRNRRIYTFLAVRVQFKWYFNADTQCGIVNHAHVLHTLHVDLLNHLVLVKNFTANQICRSMFTASYSAVSSAISLMLLYIFRFGQARVGKRKRKKATKKNIKLISKLRGQQAKKKETHGA